VGALADSLVRDSVYCTCLKGKGPALSVLIWLWQSVVLR